MSQETSLNDLGRTMNDEDSQLVDSILNDLNSTNKQQMGQPQMGQPQMAQQQMTQQQMAQQQMAQQQMAQQQMAQQQMGQQGQPPLTQEQHRAMLQQRQQAMMHQQAMLQQQTMMKGQNKSESLLDRLQNDWKSILLIIVLSVVLNSGFIDGLFKLNESTYFLLEDGNLNFQTTIIKALILGILYFLISRSI